MSAELLPLRGSVVVIGAGVAGLMTALELVPRPVIVLSKAPLGAEGSTRRTRSLRGTDSQIPR